MLVGALRHRGPARRCLIEGSTLQHASSSRSLSDKGSNQPSSTSDESASDASRPGSWVDREQAAEKHWLDRAFPGARPWLERKNRAWMIHNTTAVARKHAHLQDREGEIAQLTERVFQNLLSRHSGKAVDDRGQTHVQNACLLLASHKVLRSFLRNPQEALEAVKAQAGAHSAALLHYLLRFSMLFQRDPFDSSVRRLKALRLDLGRSFQSEVATDGRCLYKDILFEEDAMQLLECCCCSQDSVWFEGLEGQKTGFERLEWLGNGRSCCRLELTRL